MALKNQSLLNPLNSSLPTCGLDLLSRWNVDNAKNVDWCDVEKILTILFLDDYLNWPECYISAHKKFLAYGGRMCGERRRALWDRNGMLVFFADAYNSDLDKNEIDIINRNGMFSIKKLETISWIPSFTGPLLLPHYTGRRYSKSFWDNGDELHRGNLCGFRVDARKLLCGDQCNIFCQRYLLDFSGLNYDLSSIVLDYIGFCKFKEWCEKELSNQGEMVKFFIKELLQDSSFPWGLHFKDLMEYIRSYLNCKRYEVELFYYLWYNRPPDPLDRYAQDKVEEDEYKYSRRHIMETYGDIDVFNSMDRKKRKIK